MTKITFLGTSFAIPTLKRNHTSILLTHNGENILVDCGEGTQRQLRKARLNPCKINRILITHWHGDHILGIPGLLWTLSLSGYNKTLYIYGPEGTKKLMKNLLNTFNINLKFNIEVIDINKKKFFETNDFYLEAEKMTHGTPCNAYTFVKKGQIRIDKKKLKKFKIPQGIHLKKLKEGKSISYNGKKHSVKNLTYKEDDKKISFVLDTSINKKINGFVKNSDLLICEATYHSNLEKEAKEKNHLTTKQAAEIAKKSKSKRLLLTHISQRYETDLKRLLDDAKKHFKNVSIAKDLEVIEI
jgi:ribonuclease Z